MLLRDQQSVCLSCHNPGGASPAKRNDTGPMPREKKVEISPALPATPLTGVNNLFYSSATLWSFVVPAIPTNMEFATPWVKKPEILGPVAL